MAKPVRTTKTYKKGKSKSRTNRQSTRYAGAPKSGRQLHKETMELQKTARYKANKTAANIKAAGAAIAEAATPFVSSRMFENKEATKRMQNQQAALDAWKNLMQGNPDPSTGTEGSSQSNSVGNAGGGSILGG